MGIALALCFFAALAFAQSDRGTMIGTTTDPDGGAVVGATAHRTAGYFRRIAERSARAGGGQQRQHLRRGKFRWPALPALRVQGSGRAHRQDASSSETVAVLVAHRRRRTDSASS